MRPLRGWMSDLALGVRLAVGGGRTSLARFALSTFGIAVAVTVLLTASSIGTMLEQRDLRAAATFPHNEPIDGVDPLHLVNDATEFRGELVELNYVYPGSESAPVPPGMREVPAPGEMVVSPALAELLRAPEGELLRPRFTGATITAELDQIAVGQPNDLIAWLGADAELAESSWNRVYAFGTPPDERPLDAAMLSVVLVGAVALLLPVFIFVSSASRIAGAERDRRLSALRLVGSGSRQVRRIAAAESLVSALAGLVLGAAAFLVARQYVERIELFDVRVYASDVVPDPLLAVAIVLVVPALAVLTALVALRRTIIEPLGVVRRARPARRRLWWRLALLAIGVGLLLTGGFAEDGSDRWSYSVAAGAALLLVGVPVLLPWLVERVAGRIQGGPSSWQLAIRRLQLDSGTSARVVGGVAVVLAGAIALQSVLLAVERDVDLPHVVEPGPGADVHVDYALADDVMADLTSAPAVRDVYMVRNLQGYEPGHLSGDGPSRMIQVMDCAAMRQETGIQDCVDGAVYASPLPDMPRLEPGQRLEFHQYPKARHDFDVSDYEVTGTWTVPDDVHRLPPPESGGYWEVLVTPGALGDVALPDDSVRIVPVLDDGVTSDQLEQVRNAVAGYSWRLQMSSYNTADELDQEQQTYLAIRNALYAGSIFTLLLAGVSLLVLALEHIRERRRPLAVLAASGVPRGVLARSLLWQIILPIGLGVLVALATGLGLATLMTRLTDDTVAIDWTGVTAFTMSAVALSVLVSAMTLPFLRNATRLTSLRTE